MLMFTLVCLTILYVPVMSVYVKGQNYSNESYADGGQSANYWQIAATLGNLG